MYEHIQSKAYLRRAAEHNAKAIRRLRWALVLSAPFWGGIGYALGGYYEKSSRDKCKIRQEIKEDCTGLRAIRGRR